ncbi:hypothetical protein LK533_16640 [Sphingomonas sp. PL-96]|uniref:hypothetical protein n=1 Tax=Sphingomonas sp. PL-96 TaxID=2887201 RepID=UPI001E394FF8|nr:hypothetical protein [Sphingomonas sp. PL-96]MCC2978279.1 hypothetical protein [Sphingomonas sp. PL-96]
MDAVYAYLVDAGATPIDLVSPVWRTGQGPHLVRRTLLPFDENAHPPQPSALPPVVNLAPGELIARHGEEYVLAQLCEAAIEACAAENEARMTTMAAGKTNIDGRLAALQVEERLTPGADHRGSGGACGRRTFASDKSRACLTGVKFSREQPA